MIFEGPSIGKLLYKRKALIDESWHEVYISYSRNLSCFIAFSDLDFEGIHQTHNDALVIIHFYELCESLTRPN